MGTLLLSYCIISTTFGFKCLFQTSFRPDLYQFCGLGNFDDVFQSCKEIECELFGKPIYFIGCVYRYCGHKIMDCQEAYPMGKIF